MHLNPLVWPSAAKFAGVAVLVAGSAAAFVTTQGHSGNSGAAEPGVSSYLCQFSDGDILLQWNTSDNSVSGTYQDATLGGSAPSEQVDTAQGDLNGTTNGSGITLNLANFGTSAWYGTISDSVVTLNVPQQNGSIQPTTCDQSNVDGWNKAVSSLNGQVTSDNNTASQQQAQASASAAQQQALSSAQQSISTDVTTLENDSNALNTNKQLGSDINQMKQDYGQEQADYQTEQSQGSCSDGSMGGDEAAVSADSSAVDADLSALQSDIQSLQTSSGGDGIAGVQADIAAVNSDLSTLKNLGVTPAVDASGALTAGNKAVSNANAAVTWATGQGKTIDGEADQLATTAQTWETQHGC
jgi:hypothetical protein